MKYLSPLFLSSSLILGVLLFGIIYLSKLNKSNNLKLLDKLNDLNQLIDKNNISYLSSLNDVSKLINNNDTNLTNLITTQNDNEIKMLNLLSNNDLKLLELSKNDELLQVKIASLKSNHNSSPVTNINNVNNYGSETTPSIIQTNRVLINNLGWIPNFYMPDPSLYNPYDLFFIDVNSSLSVTINVARTNLTSSLILTNSTYAAFILLPNTLSWYHIGVYNL